jgi:ABC-type antimicrobial peptide transport system permease subunit
MNHLKFYVQHAIRDMTRNGLRTAFALFCIAAGVAAIVSLRTLSLIIADSLAINIAGANHGDIKVEPAFRFGSDSNMPGSNDGRQAFTPEIRQQIEDWAKAHNFQYTEVVSNANIQIAPLDNKQNVGRPQFISSYVIDPAVYPFYGPILAVNPPGVPLSKLFTGGNDVVISQNLAENNKIKVGDQVRVGRTTELFTVRGVVPTDVEGSLRNPLAAFFGFAYFSQTQAPILKVENAPDQIYMLAPSGTDVQKLGSELEQAVSVARVTTTADVRKQNQAISDVIDRLVLVMGLSALLIGAMGIIHTMLVVVGRRTMEIAVLKTLGLKSNQITLMFLVESLIMGVLGSIVGVVLGVVFSIAVRAFLQNVWPQALGWKLYPEAWLTGLSLGIVITAVFGFVPTLMASSVRPALVLRPDELKVPAMGCITTVVSVLVMVVAVGLITGQVIGNLLIGLIGVALTSIILGVIIVLLWVLVVIISMLPAFGNVDLRLALRSIGTHRTRTASTLLALIVGIFSLSLITLMAESVPRLLNFQFTNALGGNVLVFALVPSLQRPFIVGQLKGKPGVHHYQQIANYSGRLVAVNGDRNYMEKLSVTGGATTQLSGRQFSPKDLVPSALGSLGTVEVTSPGYEARAVDVGRPLGKEDSGKLNTTMQNTPWGIELGLKPGDQVTLAFGSTEITLNIVGIMNQKRQDFNSMNLSTGVFTVPADALPPGVNPTLEFTIARVDEANLNQTLVNLTSIPGVLTFDLSFFEQVLKRTLSLFSAIPTIVATLSLFVGAVIIANAVALTTLERRRQVGVMKAIGLKGSRVLLMMVLENGLVGFLGGLIGVGIGVLGAFVLSTGSQISLMESVSWGTVAILMALSLVISLIATLLSAWTAAREKPLNVLRYE